MFEQYLRDVPDFPKPGILFKDISPLLLDHDAFGRAIDAMAGQIRDYGPTHIASMEARGFLFGVPLAQQLGCSFVPLRKPGKLPWKTRSRSYTLEYGENTIEVHEDAAAPGDRVVIVDDLLATGGTAKAAVELMEELGAEVVACSFFVILEFLNGRELLGELPLHTLVSIPE